MSNAPEIKGWCPGALAPMQSGDGLLMRAKIVGSKLPLAQAKEIAAIAQDCGNGLLDLSQRAQLQMRGLSEATRERAQSRLQAIGLLAPDVATEAVLNIVASPLPCAADGLANQLARAIAAESALRALPGKFLFLVDDGSAPGLAEIGADIRLEASGAAIAVIVDGARDRAVIGTPEASVDAALAFARAFIELRAERPFALRRMRALVAELGADRLTAAAGLKTEPYQTTCQGADLRDLLGARRIGEMFFAGVAVPYGRLHAKELAGLADATLGAGGMQLRLTPWRALLALAPSMTSAERIAETARELGFIVDADDARLAVVACPGAPECPQARGQTRMGLDAIAALARALSQGSVGLHVSGCAKGCAKPSATPATLVAAGDDRFDLVEGGVASDEPVARGLTLQEIVRLFAAREIKGK
jgi:precorrin-3B synthase